MHSESAGLQIFSPDMEEKNLLSDFYNKRTGNPTDELIGRIFMAGVLLLAGAFGLFESELMQGASAAEERTDL